MSLGVGIYEPVYDWLRKAAEGLAVDLEGWTLNRRKWIRDYWVGFYERGGTTTPEDTTGTVTPRSDEEETQTGLDQEFRTEYYRYHPDRIRWFDRHYLRHIAFGVLRLQVHSVRLRRWRQSAGPRPKPSGVEDSVGP